MKENKFLIIGTVAVLVLWIGAQMWISGNWAAAAEKAKAAHSANETWKKNFKTGGNWMPRDVAEKELAGNRKQLEGQSTLLNKIEFGDANSLNSYSEKAAGSGDPANYFVTKKTQLLARTTSQNIRIPDPDQDLGMGRNDKSIEDAVALNLLRLAMLDHLLVSCQKVGVAQVSQIRHHAPKFIPFEADADGDTNTKKKDEKDSDKEKDADDPKSEPPTGSRLVQFHLRVNLLLPERAFGRLMYEVQRPSENNRGYLCLRGFHVAARDKGSGMMEASLAVSALLSEKSVKDLKIAVKGEEARSGPATKNVDLNRY